MNDYGAKIGSKKRVLLDELIKNIKPGRILLIKGPKGSGKTTLLKQAMECLEKQGINRGNITYKAWNEGDNSPYLFENYQDNQEKSERNPDQPEYIFLDEPNSPPKISSNTAIIASIGGLVHQNEKKWDAQSIKSLVLWPFSLFEIISFSKLSHIAMELRARMEDFLSDPDEGFHPLLGLCEKLERENIEELEMIREMMEKYLRFGGFPEFWFQGDIFDGTLMMDQFFSHIAKKAKIRSLWELRQLAVKILHLEDGFFYPLKISRAADISFVSARKWAKTLVDAGLFLEISPRQGKPKGNKKIKKLIPVDPILRAVLGANCSRKKLLEEYLLQQLNKFSDHRKNGKLTINYWASPSGNQIPIIMGDGKDEIPIIIREDGGAGRGFGHFVKAALIKNGILAGENLKIKRIGSDLAGEFNLNHLPLWAFSAL